MGVPVADIVAEEIPPPAPQSIEPTTLTIATNVPTKGKIKHTMDRLPWIGWKSFSFISAVALIFLAILLVGYILNLPLLLFIASLVLLTIVSSIGYLNVWNKDKYLSDSARDHSIQSELMEARERAVVAGNSKTDFMAFLCHELRNPLHAVISMADQLKETTLNHDQAESVFTIQASSELMLAITNDILDLSKIEAGKIELEYLPVDVLAMVKSIARANQQWAAGKGVILKYDVDPKIPPCIFADPTRLNQMITNFVSNAVKFTPTKGTVTISVCIHPDNPAQYLNLPHTSGRIESVSAGVPALNPPPPGTESSKSKRAQSPSTHLPLLPAIPINNQNEYAPVVPSSRAVHTVDPNSKRLTLHLPPRPLKDAHLPPSHERSRSGSELRNNHNPHSNGIMSPPTTEVNRFFSTVKKDIPRPQQNSHSATQHDESVASTPRSTTTKFKHHKGPSVDIKDAIIARRHTPSKEKDGKNEGNKDEAKGEDETFRIQMDRIGHPTDEKDNDIHERKTSNGRLGEDLNNKWHEGANLGAVTLQFSVKDTGIGIPPEYMDALFEPYSQAKRSMTTEHGGTGLGLAIVERLGNLMQGWFDVESEVGKGSTFTFTGHFNIAPPPSPNLRSIIKQASTDQGVRNFNYTTLHTQGINPNGPDSNTLDTIDSKEDYNDCISYTRPVPNAARSSDAIKQVEQLSRCVSPGSSSRSGVNGNSPEMNARKPNMPYYVPSSHAQLTISSSLQPTPTSQPTLSNSNNGGLMSPSELTSGKYENMSSVARSSLPSTGITLPTIISASPSAVQSASPSPSNATIPTFPAHLPTSAMLLPAHLTTKDNDGTNTPSECSTPQQCCTPLICATPVGLNSIQYPDVVANPNINPVSAANANKCILVVDDSFINRKIMMKILSDYQTDQAENGLQAVQMVDADPSKYCCILMDLMMPCMGGTEALTQIRQRGHTVPIIAVTANTMNQDVAQCLALGFNGFLSKPCRKDQVRTLLATVMSKANESTQSPKKVTRQVTRHKPSILNTSIMTSPGLTPLNGSGKFSSGEIPGSSDRNSPLLGNKEQDRQSPQLIANKELDRQSPLLLSRQDSHSFHRQYSDRQSPAISPLHLKNSNTTML